MWRNSQNVTQWYSSRDIILGKLGPSFLVSLNLSNKSKPEREKSVLISKTANMQENHIAGVCHYILAVKMFNFKWAKTKQCPTSTARTPWEITIRVDAIYLWAGKEERLSEDYRWTSIKEFIPISLFRRVIFPDLTPTAWLLKQWQLQLL